MTKATGQQDEELAVESSDFWTRSPGVIRSFLEKRPDYEQLCNEIRYTLEKRLSKDGIEFSTITARAKTLNRFLDKMARKKYRNPFSEITDFAGVRVVCLYVDDITLIEKIIEDEFVVVEKVDKLTDKEPDQFGYGAIHYIVKLGKKSAGARYDDLRAYVCEIQVRTVLQDAWAIIGHHLVYKRESAVPKALQRKLNSLAGLFETADDQFQQVRNERERYLARVTDSRKSAKAFLSNETNLDSMKQYLAWKFPALPLDVASWQLQAVFGDIDLKLYPTLSEIEGLIREEEARVALVFQKAAESFAKKDGKIPSCMNLGISLALRNPALLDDYSPEVHAAVEAVRADAGPNKPDAGDTKKRA